MCSQLQAAIVCVYMKQCNLAKMAAQMKLIVSEGEGGGGGDTHKLNPDMH